MAPRPTEPQRAGRPATVEERLTKREHAFGWALFGLFALAALVVIGLLVLAVPLVVIAFPLTLTAIAIIVAIGWWRKRRPG